MTKTMMALLITVVTAALAAVVYLLAAPRNDSANDGKGAELITRANPTDTCRPGG